VFKYELYNKKNQPQIFESSGLRLILAVIFFKGTMTKIEKLDLTCIPAKM